MNTPTTAKPPETYTHAKWLAWQWASINITPLAYGKSAVSATGLHKACVQVVQKLTAIARVVRAECALMRSLCQAKHKQAETSFKKPVPGVSPVCQCLKNYCDHIAKALPVTQIIHLIILLLSTSLIWIAGRLFSSGK